MHPFNFRRLINEAPLLFFGGLMLAAAVALVRYVMLPQIEQLVAHQQELAHYQSLISSENGYAQIKQEITGKIQILKSRLIPQPEQKKLTADLSSFLEMLINIARKADIQFIRMQPQEESKNADYTLCPVMLVLTTTYHELGQFIAALEKLPHLFRIDRLAMAATSEGRCEVKILVTCLIPLEAGQ